MKNVVIPFLIGTMAALPFSAVIASTTLEYSAECKYYDANQALKYSGPCKANWGVGMNDGDGYQRYILTYPNGSEVWIYIDSEGDATVNDIAAISLKAPQGFEKVMTTQGEVFEFTEGSE